MNRCSVVAFTIGALVAGAFLLGAPRLSAAATVEFETGAFKRQNDPNSGIEGEGYPRNTQREEASDGINIEECDAGEIWHFEAITTDAAGMSLYMYAGESCSD